MAESESYFDLILEALVNKEWHSLEEIAKKCCIEPEIAEKIIVFLDEFGFIEYDKSLREVKIEPEMVTLYGDKAQ